MELKELYQEIILDHGKNPRNFGKCKDFTSDGKGHNPLCGDKVHIYAQLDKNKKILDLSFEGEGCAISLASASILTDVLKGKDFNVANIIIDNFLNLIKENKSITWTQRPAVFLLCNLLRPCTHFQIWAARVSILR